MSPRHVPRASRLPRLWLFTDERAEAGLLAALARLPPGAGIVFRHHATPLPARRALYEQVRRIARRRRLVLVLAGPASLAIAWRADGVHGARSHGSAPRALVRTMPAHDRRDLVQARRLGVDLAFLSPVFATRSHPGAPTLGRVRFGLAARSAVVRVAALGGIDRRRFVGLAPLAYGWGAIDGWAVDQKRKVVPR